jgi:hypothetical protein
VCQPCSVAGELQPSLVALPTRAAIAAAIFHVKGAVENYDFASVMQFTLTKKYSNEKSYKLDQHEVLKLGDYQYLLKQSQQVSVELH